MSAPLPAVTGCLASMTYSRHGYVVAGQTMRENAKRWDRARAIKNGDRLAEREQLRIVHGSAAVRRSILGEYAR